MNKPEKFHGKYRIPTARAQWHNYNGGTYFVTICTKDKHHYFGEIYGGKMHLSQIGNMAIENLNNLQSHYPYAEVPLFVIMPNHIHAIIFINTDNVETMCTSSQNAHNAQMEMCTSSQKAHSTQMEMRTSSQITNATMETMYTSSLRQLSEQRRWKTVTVNEGMRQISHKRGALSVAVSGFKRAITHFAHQNSILFAWQPRFHDHIIRNLHELNKIADYIENNVARWDMDTFNDEHSKQ